MKTRIILHAVNTRPFSGINLVKMKQFVIALTFMAGAGFGVGQAEDVDKQASRFYSELKQLRVRNIDFAEGRIDFGLAELEKRINEAFAARGQETRVSFIISNKEREEPLRKRLERYRTVLLPTEGDALSLITSIAAQAIWQFELKEGGKVVFHDWYRERRE